MSDPVHTTHPSYGVIGASRWTAGGKGLRLFGSKLPGHNAGVTITIKDAFMEFDHGHERISGACGDVLAQVTLTPVQWAELLTSMNMGDGVPCTVTYVRGDQGPRPEPPDVEPEPERVRQEFKGRLKNSVEALKNARATAATKLKGKVPMGLAREIDEAFRMAQQEIESNAPWYVEQFTEATDRVVNSAKAEVDAFLTNVATKLGVKALKMGGVQALLEEDEP